MDFRNEIPSMDQLGQWAKGYENDIRKMLAAPKNQYDIEKVTDNNKPSYVCVPMRILGKWIMMTWDVCRHSSGWVLFDDWNWKKIEYFIPSAAGKIQRAVVRSGLCLTGTEAENNEDWKCEGPIKFYSDNDRLECVQPVDRLMVLMNTLKLSSFEGSKILGSYLRANRKDKVILEKLRLIQASCLIQEEEGAVLKYFVPVQERMRRDGSNSEPVPPEGD
jgi:hypothetical protein